MGLTINLTSSQLHHQPPILPPNSTTLNPPSSSIPTPNPNPSPNPSHYNMINISHKNNNKQIDKVIPWTSSIARHCRNSNNLSRAIKELTQMRLSGIEPNHVTLTTLISAISNHHPTTQHYPLAASIHAYTRKLGLDTSDTKLATSLIRLYSKYTSLGLARRVFDHLCEKNTVTWNTMIDAYMRNDSVADALQLFGEMPDTARDAVTWTVMIGGFVRSGDDDAALEWFCQMLVSGVQPDYVTVIAVLSAVANVGALGLGMWVHRFVIGKKFMDNLRLCNTLIDMYSRCGRVDFARQVFDRMTSRSVVSWNSMVGGYAANGCVEEALIVFETMQKEGFKPDGVSFTGALTACSHAGLVDRGLEYFDDMTRVHRVSPRIEHYGCLVDLYSRAGRLEDALNVVKNMPMKPNEVVLGSLLGACRNCGDIELAEIIMKYLVEVDPRSESNYVMLANMYAAVGSWEGAGMVRRRMKRSGIQKRPGVSSIEINGNINEFVAGDRSHSEAESIYEILELLSYELGTYGCI